MVEKQLTGSVSREIAAPPEVVWALVSDVTRMGEWSPETTSCGWVGAAADAGVGAKFKGRNENDGHRWTTTCTVVASDPGRLFSFESAAMGMKIARWEYRFEPSDTGCLATESWTDLRNRFVDLIAPRVSGVRDRATHNEATMRTSLDRLAAAAEGST